ncbi:mechanosensitive ion channel protein MscS [Haloferula helveola]|uniref:Mechanosensitive ion channel protein MscS n=1 Tax=Haloferula helveola TaxID=490095 RepID=A0ABM7RDC0_9BACT|nr:mechanosensitive ion channel protein MscS [Haloferula helveola]
MKRVLFLLLVLLGFAPFAGAQDTKNQDPAFEPAPLVVWNREITVFRAPLGNLTPEQRLSNALSKIADVEDFELYEDIRGERTSLGDLKTVSFMIGDEHLFAVVETDLDPTTGETLDSLTKTIISRLEEVRDAKREQRSVTVILKGVGVAIAATAAFLGLLWFLRFLGRKLRRYMVQRTSKLKQLKVRNFDFRPMMLQAIRRVIVMIGWGVALFAGYVWIVTVLGQFPYTAPWGHALGERLRTLTAGLLQSFVDALPGVIMVIVIFALTRWVARLADNLFRQLEHTKDDDSWLGSDTARASRRIVVVLVWIFGITIAYPYIPGSESPAFKGISVFVGLVLSLGSTGLVNQVMSGFVVLYSGAVRTGEYAKVGDTEGVIQDIGLLSTKVLTPRREYVTVPNAVLIAKETLNYSRIEENEQRTELSTKVTIGYDTPWRQVHAMLLLATERTPGIRKKPEPRVIQTALSDFYAEYELRFVPSDVAKKGVILSDLHQRIQDTFNEFEVQIMSPNFRSQPEEPVLTPKDKWFLAPSEPEGDKKGGGKKA